MARERVLMRYIREILRLKGTLRGSHRETARSLWISAGRGGVRGDPSEGDGPDVAAVGELGDRQAGASAVWAEAGPDRRAAGSRSGVDAHRVTLPGRHAVTPPSRVPGGPCGRLPVLRVLRALPALAAAARTSMRQVHTAGEKTSVDCAGLSRACGTRPSSHWQR
jgi:hypothetical protein